MFTQNNARPISKASIGKYWANACKKAHIINAHFHDIRAKALTDKEERDGITAAQRMGGIPPRNKQACIYGNLNMQSSPQLVRRMDFS